MTIDEMKQRKRELGLTNQMIAEASGVPLGTVQKIFGGETKSPRKATIDAITAVLARKGGTLTRIPGPGDLSVSTGPEAPEKTAEGLYDRICRESSKVQTLREAEAAYVYNAFPKGEYTTEDYYALPDEQRVELIDGFFYDMSAPAVVHQTILGELYLLFRECADQHECPCRVLLSPCDVRLDRDNKTMVQPDLIVICEGFDVHAKALEGGPDLTVEILSPSTRAKDMLLKLHKYRGAGVREYWIIDPEYRKILVYDFEGREPFSPVYYDFSETIPIGISDGRCSIDFSKVYRAISDYYRGL